MSARVDLSLLGRILRSPAAIAADCRDDRGTSSMAATSLVVIVAGVALFGATVGSWQGGLQTWLAAAKLPLAIVATLVLSAPAYYGISAVFERPWSARSVVSLMLAAGARLALVLLAATPALWLAIDLGASYDAAKLLATLAFALAGLAALSLLVRGVGEGEGKRATLALFVGVFLLVGAQASWILRPYIGTPGENDVVYFTRAHEGGLANQLSESVSHVLGSGRAPRRAR